jgi:hypothetical protein
MLLNNERFYFPSFLNHDFSALLDAALSNEEIHAIESILNEYKRQDIQFQV